MSYVHERIVTGIAKELEAMNAVYRDLQEKYNELLLAVGNKYPGESRHQTALRYIREREDSRNTGAEVACQA